MTKFDPTKPVQTRDGAYAEILWTDGGGSHPIGGFYLGRDAERVASSWSNDGVHYSFRELDLINIPEKPTTIERWVNVYSDGAVGSINHLTAERAFRDGGPNCQQVHLTGTFTPGEGLDNED